MSELKFIEQIIDEKSAMLIEANDKIWHSMRQNLQI